jgi:hypothetical protein
MFLVQNAAGDAPCLEVDGMAADACPADVDPLSPSTAALPTLCRWASHIRLYKQHAKDATGPTFARQHASIVVPTSDLVETRTSSDPALTPC